jgi:hypothetical protein
MTGTIESIYKDCTDTISKAKRKIYLLNIEYVTAFKKGNFTLAERYLNGITDTREQAGI